MLRWMTWVYQRCQCYKKRLLYVGLILLGCSLCFVLYLRIAPLPISTTDSTSLVYDATGRVLDQLGGGFTEERVTFDELPKEVILATLAAEDRFFYDHFGFSFRGILRALWKNIQHGGVLEGASTLTQQLARNLYLNHHRTWKRKFREAIYALQLEMKMDKDQILELYLNTVYYGHGAYGIGSAAKLYFGKSIQDVTLAEAAFLAALPRGPVQYSPYRHWNRAKERQRLVLSLMYKDHMISPKQVEEAESEELHLRGREEDSEGAASYVRGPIVSQVMRISGWNEEMVRQGGLRIYTTIDRDLQRKAESIVSDRLSYHAGLQGALISADPHTGFVRALVGGDHPSKSPYHRAFSRRQPGSTFKMMLYWLALEKGFTPVTSMESVPTMFFYDGKSYRPSNDHKLYANRSITLQEAIKRSDNIYAVNTYFRVGGEDSVRFARRLGIASSMQATPSLALGSYVVTPWELTEAYTALAAQGVHRPLQLITKIEDATGRLLYFAHPKQERVASKQSSYVLTHLLRSVFQSGGTAHAISSQVPRNAVAKTGSTPWDGWLAGFTPDLVTTTWVGYDQNHEVNKEQIRSGQFMWSDFMQYATKDQIKDAFVPPTGVKRVWIDVKTGMRATPQCPNIYEAYFVEGTEPKEFCSLHDHFSNKGSFWKRFQGFWKNIFDNN